MSSGNEIVQTRGHHRIEFIDLTDSGDGDAVATPYEMPDITESFTFLHKEANVVINRNVLIDIRVLGRGRYAENVMLCEVSDNPDLYMAVKRLSLHPTTNNSGDYTTQTDLRTIRVIGSGENSFVTKYFGAFKDKEFDQLVICMEVCDASLDRFSVYMHELNQTQHLDTFLKRMISHIANALSFLKDKNILHRDVKPSNILINRAPVQFKLCDFGISAIMIDLSARTMMKGTQIYLAPERIDRNLSPNGYKIQSDMWALGLSILQVANNEHPFLGLEAVAIMGKLKTWNPEPSASLANDLQQLTLWLLKSNHEERPSSYDQILSSAAIQSLPNNVTDEEKEMVNRIITHLLTIPIDTV